MARFSQNSGGSGSGSALNYVQVAGGQATITSAPSSIIDLDITTTGKPVQISVTGEGSNASAGSWVRVNLFRDGVAIGNEMQIEASAVSENVPLQLTSLMMFLQEPTTTLLVLQKNLLATGSSVSLLVLL